MNKSIVFFDGVCNFCNSTVDFIWKNNVRRSLHYSSLQSDYAQKFLTEHKLPIDDFDTIYFVENGKIYSKSTAVMKISSHFSFPYRFLLKLGWIFPRFIRDSVYDFISKHRYSFIGKMDTCRIPNSEEKAYFLE